jgi:cytochrome c5
MFGLSVMAGFAEADNANGEAVYDSTCFSCHGPGMSGAPRLGDRDSWGPRVAKGEVTLYEHALKGFRAMPARGGNAKLQDEQVKAAVDYMVRESK